MHLKLRFCTTLFPPKINLFISFSFLSLPFHACHTIAKLFNSKLTSIRGSFDFRKFPRDKQYFQFGRGFMFQTNSRTDDVAIFGKILYHVENKQSRDKKKKERGKRWKKWRKIAEDAKLALRFYWIFFLCFVQCTSY